MGKKEFEDYFKKEWVNKVNVITTMDYTDLKTDALHRYNTTIEEFEKIFYENFTQCDECAFFFNEKKGRYIKVYKKRICDSCQELRELGEIKIRKCK